ncbi:ATP-dependent Clp protease proteolytic subunit [Devosia sp.]|uniref:ATP-dependent Clp protease proteolytic subunit n=1 Tax=Devosia sp. TaxID=1871048 RepID=UPI0025BC7513|nr:ATP-dependent Clp protease proteolytic subunit [Devosia sp.]
MKTHANARIDSEQGPLHRRLIERAAAVDDGNILRVAFFALLLGTASVLYVDYRELTANEGAALAMPMRPILPPYDPEGPADGNSPNVTTSPQVLEQPLEITLGTGGQLLLTGSIDLGSAARFAAEIEARGEYVQTVVLDSPGGSVVDALAIGSLIHEKGLATKVAAGSLCASSCPIIFASGAERIASPEAAIGVHQIYAAALSGDPQNALRVAGTAMSDAQTTTAEIISHLTKTGVDPALWLHALETPPDRLYYFNPEEMTRLKLVTQLADS